MPMGNRFLLFFTMIFLHIIDDFYLQGILINLKQKSWWKEQTDDKLYKNDYKIALLIHGFSWSFTITLPYLIISLTTDNDILVYMLIATYILNTIAHAYIDHTKANKRMINLIVDQLLHMFQILMTWILIMSTL